MLILSDLLQGCSNKAVTIMIQQYCGTTLCCQPCITFLLYHDCIRLVSKNNLITSLIMPSSLLQVVNNLFQTCYNKLGTSSANTTCWQLVNRLVTTCLQTCNNLCILRVPVRPCIVSCITLLNNRNMLRFSFLYTASQMWCLFQFLPIMIGDLIHNEILEHWNCFTMLWNIVQICTSPEIKKEDVPYLRLLIHEHHTLF